MYQRSSTQFQSTRQKNWSRGQNATRFVSSVKLGPVAHTVLVALMITVLGLIYLTQATRVASYDYTTNEIDTQIAELTNKKADLEIETARLTALETIKTSSVAREMTTPASTTYIRQ